MKQLNTIEEPKVQLDEESLMSPSSPDWNKFLRMLNGKGGKTTPATLVIKSKKRAKAKAARKARRINR
jgi:hypothetical protein